MANDVDVRRVANDSGLEDAIRKANAAAEKLLRCAESISNPTYSIVMEGRELEILAVRHFQGQIAITVKSPLDHVEAQRRAALAVLGASALDHKTIKTIVGPINHERD